MAVDPIATWRAQLDQAEELARAGRDEPVHDDAGDFTFQGPDLVLRLVAGQRRLLEELEGACRRDNIEFLEQREAPPELPARELLPGLKRAAQILAGTLSDPQQEVRDWLERMADRWMKNGAAQPGVLHTLAADCWMSMSVADIDMFEVLAGPREVMVVFSARLHDNTVVSATGRTVKIAVMP